MLLVGLLWLACLPLVLATMLASMHPTRTLAARSVPVSTLDPVSLRLPQGVPAGRDMSLLYVGQGFQTQTTVYAMVTGKPNVGDGPRTQYMYQDQTAVQVYHMSLSSDVGGQALTGHFDLGCSKATVGQDWVCKYGYETSQSTSTYTSFTTPLRPTTVFTPVKGLIQSMRKATASGPPLPKPTTQTNAGSTAPSRALPVYVALLAALVAAGAWLL